MADKERKFPENVPGKYFVDKECIACDACILTAPDHFSMHPDDGHAFVKTQPVTPEDEDLCREALEGCPVEAIGNDGGDDSARCADSYQPESAASTDDQATSPAQTVTATTRLLKGN